MTLYFTEKDIEQIISKHSELLEEGLVLIGRQVSVGGLRVDLLFKDRFGETLVVELKRGTIKRKHVGQIMEYSGSLYEGKPVRLMLVGNRVPRSFQRSLEYHGIEWRELSEEKLLRFLIANDRPLLERLRKERLTTISIVPPIKVDKQSQRTSSKYDPAWIKIFENVGGPKTILDRARAGEIVFVPANILRKHGERGNWAGMVVLSRRGVVRPRWAMAHVRALKNTLPPYIYPKEQFKFSMTTREGELALRIELIPPSAPGKPKTKVEVYEFSGALGDAEKSLNVGMYRQAIKEYGTVIEQLFRQLYREYLPNLSYSDKEKIINYERKIGSSINKFTIGQWLGLFREAHLFKAVFQDKKKRAKDKCFIFFTPTVIDIINTLRNKCTHPDDDVFYIEIDYDIKHVAYFVKSAVLCILLELNIFPKR